MFTLVQHGHNRAALMVVLFAALRLGFNNLFGRNSCGSVSGVAVSRGIHVSIRDEYAFDVVAKAFGGR